MASAKSAGRYATALLDLSLEKGIVEKVEADLLYFVDLLKVSDDFRVFLSSPVIRDDKKISVYRIVLKDFNDLTLGFFTLVTKNGREPLLPEIAKQFHRLLAKHRNIVSGTLTSSIPLDGKVKEAIVSKISASFEGTLSLTELVDPSLLGGFIIRIEDKQIDASIASQLKQLKQELVK